MARIEVREWVGGFIESLYEFRGWRIESDEVASLLDRQGESWRRLMVQSGLNADQVRAEEVAFEFGKVKVIGGAGRLFESFASFLRQNPKLGERAVNSPSALPPAFCEDCDNRGYLDVPMISMKTKERYTRAHKCSCLHGVKYAGLPAAMPEMIEEVWRLRGQETSRLGIWLKERNIPVGPDDEFRLAFREWVDGQGSMFRKVDNRA